MKVITRQKFVRKIEIEVPTVEIALATSHQLDRTERIAAAARIDETYVESAIEAAGVARIVETQRDVFVAGQSEYLSREGHAE